MTFTCKLQLEIIKDFMQGKTPKFWGFGEKTAISTDGIVAAIFYPEELVFDLSMDQCVELGSHMDKYYELFETASPVKRTMEYKVFNSYLLEKFHCDENEPFDVYIQKKLADKFPNCDFFAVSPTDPVFAVLPFGGPVGMIMPVKTGMEGSK